MQKKFFFKISPLGLFWKKVTIPDGGGVDCAQLINMFSGQGVKVVGMKYENCKHIY